MSLADYPTFTLNCNLTKEQIDFFDQYGFIHFKGFADKETVEGIIRATEEIQEKWISEGKEKNNGIPIKYGKDENGKTIVQRFSFASLNHPFISKFVNSGRLETLKMLMPEGSRIAENEKDGVVVNHYVNTDESQYAKMGWHTDSIRDIFYGKRVKPMLNVGIYLDNSSEKNGGLRILPGTHKQGVWGMMFKKKYFMGHDHDDNEMLVRAEAGDMVIHDGRIWHRVAEAPVKGAESRRRVMYIPVICGDYMPKDENSKTPFYMHFLKFIK